MTIRVAIVDDHRLVVAGLEAALSQLADVEIVARSGSVEGARSILVDEAVDVVLLDLRLTDGNALALLAETANHSRRPVLVLSSFETPQYVGAALRFCAQGFLLKTAPIDDLVAAIRTVSSGGLAFTADQLRDATTNVVRLTTREREIVRLVVAGRSNEEIGYDLGASRKTVEAHLTHLYERYGLASRVELALRAERDRWLDLPALEERPARTEG